MTDHQKLLLEVMEAVDTLCRQQNIRYVMLGGTMLGAYRHQGFIPWDDDIDIGMPREDYERFLRVAGEKLQAPYEFRHFSVERNVPYAFARVENRETTYIEARRSGAGYRGGVYVEIFPLDVAPEGNLKQRFREAQIKFQKKRLYALIMQRGAEGRNPLKRLVIAVFRATGSIDGVTRKLDKMLRKDAVNSSGVYYGNLLGHWGRKENVPAEVMFPQKEYRFEDKLFFGVRNPDRYLTSLYGADYMTPPSEEEQNKGKHEAVYCDLHRSYKEF